MVMLRHHKAQDAQLMVELTEEVEGSADVYLPVLVGTREHAGNLGTICLLAKRRHFGPILMAPCP